MRTDDNKPGTLMIHSSHERTEEYQHEEPGVIRHTVMERITNALERLWEEEGKEPAELRIEEGDGQLRIMIFTAEYIERERGPEPERQSNRDRAFADFLEYAKSAMASLLQPPGAAPPFPVPSGGMYLANVPPGGNPVDYIPADPRKFSHEFEPQIGDEIEPGLPAEVCRRCHGGKFHSIHKVDARPVQ